MTTTDGSRRPFGEVLLPHLSRRHWTAIFTELGAEASPSVVRNVTRTLNALLTWSEEWEYFGANDPFGVSAAVRNEKAKKARDEAYKKCATVASLQRGITLKHCPDMAAVTDLAEAVECVYPGYGRRMVWLALGTGLRIGEILALRVEQVDLAEATIHVTQQLDRNQHWPATALPKGGKVRDALVWTAVLPIAETLVEDARAREGADRGWLFPRHRSTVAWAEKAGHLVGEAIEAVNWPWTFHWLRHAYASWLLAPASVGGYGQAPADVQGWLGHAKLSTTLDTYVQGTPGGLSLARGATESLPGLG